MEHSEKKEYREPQLTEYGSIEELTKGSEIGVGDAVDFQSGT